MTIWFTSDNHFGHENIIKYTNRPFKSVDEMDEQMINNWNEKVKDDDIVYHLGDFTLGDEETAKKYFSQLKGRIRILGNVWHHDKRWINNFNPIFSKNERNIEVLWPMTVLEFPEYSNSEYPQVLVLCHYPIAEWDRKYHGSWHLHGHSHGTHKYGADDLAFDVGVDCTEFYPISIDEVNQKMKDIKERLLK